MASELTDESPNRLSAAFPILSWLPSYRKAWLGRDVIAGAIVVCLLVPEGMAYAQIAGMPPETAFYVAPPALLLYAIFASSRKLVVVVSATQAALSAGAVAALATAGTPEYEELTAALALLVGAITVAAGLLRLGVVARFFSPSVLVGFVSGLALVISIKQVPKVLGIEAGEGDFWERLWDILVNLDDVHRTTLVVGLATIAVMVVVERFAHRLPAALVALVFGIVVSRAFDLAERGVEVIEEIPSGLAAPQLPDVTLNDLSLLFASAVGIALVNFAEGNSMAREFARRDGAKLDADQELIGLGAANVGAGLFQGFTIGASLSKSSAAYAAGMQTQMAGIVAAGFTVLVALFLTGLFEGLPEATLGAIVIVAVSSMVKTQRLRELYTLKRTDFALAAVALLAVLSLETLTALMFAVALSIVLLVVRAAQAPLRRLGEQPGGAFVALERYPDAREHPTTLVIRPDAALFFANAEAVAEEVYLAATESEPPVRAVVVDLELTRELDVPAAEALGLLAGRLAEAGIPLALARIHGPAIDLLERTGVVEAVGRERVGGRVEDAVRAFESTGAGTAHPQ
jgi:high affinity sulfate transporter 1